MLRIPTSEIRTTIIERLVIDAIIIFYSSHIDAPRQFLADRCGAMSDFKYQNNITEVAAIVYIQSAKKKGERLCATCTNAGACSASI